MVLGNIESGFELEDSEKSELFVNERNESQTLDALDVKGVYEESKE
jgi:hypothetical protein